MEVSKKNITIKAKIYKIGNDTLISIYGGDKPHIGASVLSSNTQEKSIQLGTHKDDIALKIISKQLRKYIKNNICLVGGIHVENITKKQISLVLKLCEKLSFKILKKLLK